MHRKNSRLKSLGSLYLTLMFIAAVILSTPSGLASAQNKTYLGTTSIKGTLANTTKVNIVLVHGLWDDASSWDNVIPILQVLDTKLLLRSFLSILCQMMLP